MSVNIWEDSMQHATIFDKPVLYTNWLINRLNVPDNWFCYDLRGTDKSPCVVATLEDRACTNHVGTILSPVPLKKPSITARRVNGTFSLLGELLDLEGFCEEHDLAYPHQDNRLILRPASPDEAGLFYSNDPDKDRELACVGHLRMDFGSSGEEFWHSWWPHNDDEYNTPEFKGELDEVVHELRRKGPLENASAMLSFCHSRSEGKLGLSASHSYGYILETERFRYCLRCTPDKGDYSYLYVYDKCQQELNRTQSIGLTGISL